MSISIKRAAAWSWMVVLFSMLLMGSPFQSIRMTGLILWAVGLFLQACVAVLFLMRWTPIAIKRVDRV
jgi:hypothetical protein